MGEEIIERTSEQRDSIELKMDAKGNQYWIIKVYFDRLTEPHTNVIDSIHAIDKEMRERFGGK